MTEQLRTKTTAVLEKLIEGGSSADELMTLVYDDLRRLAASFLRSERPEHTLSATDLVHEVYTRMVDQTRVDWNGRAHFFAVAAQAMRRVLIDHARRRRRVRRGGDQRRVTLGDSLFAEEERDALSPEEMLTLNAALERLALLDPHEAKVVELKFFIGLSNEEIGQCLGVSTRSVAREWLHAQTCLRRELGL
jgi:RNA polymerase sigma factor (TIGR02999 family)